MKQLVPFALLLTAQSAFAQNCFHVTYPPLMPDWSAGWNDASVDPSGGVLFTEWTLAMNIARTAPDGQPGWSKRLIHMSPNIWLSPGHAEPRADGGCLVNGWFYPQLLFEAPCIVSFAPDGQTEWARIYMADSTYEMLGGSFVRVQQRADGDLLATVDNPLSYGLAKLDASGIPLWYNRYSFTEMGGNQQMGSVATILEPGDAVTVLGHGFTLALSTIMRINADGSTQWSYTYDLGMARPNSMVRAADGSYFACGHYNSSEGFVVHFGSDGTFDWMRSYPVPFSGIGQLPAGDLIVTSNNGDPGLLQLGTDGTPTAAWNSTLGDDARHLIGLRGDSIYVQNQFESWTGLTIAASVNDLACAFTATSTPAGTLLGAPASVSDTLIVTPDELKTWTMNIGDSPALDEVDVQAFGGSGPARPGFNHMIFVTTSNMGGSTAGPLTRTLTFDPLLTLVSAYPTPSSIVGNTVTWTGPDSLVGFTSAYAYVEVSLPADPGLIGTILSSTFTVVQDSVETDLANNTITVTREITGSYDPNDKQVSPRDFYHIENDSILDYTIQFQNTGNDTAFTVVVSDTLPLSVDTRTFQLGATSHPCTYTLTGNGILTFTFSNILLPDSNTNEPMSHGLVNFRIKPILPLQLGQEITNTADIYFDFNPPIHTPAATVVVTDETGVRPLVKPAQLVVYPVPTKNVLTAVLPEGFKPVQAFSIGVDGRRLPMVLPSSTAGQVQFAIQHLPAGAYVLNLRAQDGGRLSARFVKE